MRARGSLLLAALAVPATAAAQSAPTLALKASLRRPGHIALTVTGSPGAPVTITEGTRPVATATLDAAGTAKVADAGDWDCRQRQRTFTTSAPPQTTTAEVTTPSCRHRFSLVARHPRAGRATTVVIRDRFHLPRAGRVCATGPVRARVCADAARATRLTLPRPGRWSLVLRADGVTARRTITVRRRPGHLRLLATGDSMIQIIDGFLQHRLAPGDVGVRSDAHISSGLSKPRFFNWPRHARRVAARYRPDVTVMFIGANDGYPLGGAACCGRRWQRRYGRIASAVMGTYARTGAVFWCLLPAPRDRPFRRVFVAVNAALRRAAARHRGAVHLVDLPATFTPGYRFRQHIPWQGRSPSVRQDDGVHLNVAGAAIAATLIIRALHEAGQL